MIEPIPQCRSRYASGGGTAISFLKIAIALIFFRLLRVHKDKKLKSDLNQSLEYDLILLNQIGCFQLKIISHV